MPMPEYAALKFMHLRRILSAVFIFLFIVDTSKAGTKFIPNNGQWPTNVLYRADLPGGAFFLEKHQITYFFFDQNALHQIFHNFKKEAIIQNQVVRIQFSGSSGSSSVENTGTKSSEYYNYFIGNDPSKWVSDIHATDGITMHNVWPGIDLKIQTSGDGIKYTFVVLPFANPELIRLKYLGSGGLNIDENDSLHINTSLINMVEQPPFAYQHVKQFFKTAKKYEEIDTRYRFIDSTTIGFQLNAYSHRDTLVIDPIVIFATFSGSKADNFGFTGTFNPEGNGYSGGTVYAPGFPTTTGAFQVKYQGGFNTTGPNGLFDYREYGRDAGILKYNPDGTKLIWATYLGGSNNEQPHSMIVNSKGELLVFGTTASANFPVTSGAYDTHYHGNGDIYIAKLSADGNKLLASTFIGGGGRDGFNGDQPYVEPTGPLAFNYGDAYRGEVIVDKSDNVLIASCTQSPDLATKSPFQNHFGGVQDGLVLKLNPDLSALFWMSYIGGKDQDAAYGIHLDNSENIFVCGGTQSADFPTTVGTISPSYNGGIDGFLIKLTPDGQAMEASTYLGTADYDQNYLVQTDGSNFVYVTGQSLGSFPVSSNVYSNPNSKNFIAKIDNNLTKILASTVIGSGSNLVNLSPSAFLVDICGRVYLSGWGGNANNWYHAVPTGNTNGLTVTPDAYQKRTNGSNFYLIILSKNMTNLVYATFFGGLGTQSEEHVDGGTSRFDRNGIVYQSVCGGCGGYSDFPTTPNAWSRRNNGVRAYDKFQGGCNNAMFKIDLNSADFPPRMYDTLIVKQVGQDIDYSFEIFDPQGDSVYVKATSTVFDPKLVPVPAVFSADSGLGHVTAHFHWVTDCNHYLGDTVVIAVTAHNNSCPVPRTITHFIKIVMKMPVVPPPPAMFCIEHLDANTVKINWTAVPDPKNLKEVRLVKRMTNGQDQILKISDGLSPDHYIDHNAIANIDTNYRYFLYTVSACGNVNDTGRVAGTVPEKDSIPKVCDVYTVSVEHNKFIRVIWNKYALPNFYRYYVYRKENIGAAVFKIYKEISKQTDTTFLDSNVNVQAKSYCYKIFVESQCGIFSPGANEGCSILLTGKSLPFEHDLSWNPYTKWTNGVKSYDVLRRDPSKSDSLINNISGNLITYKDDSLNYDEGLYWYHVIGREGSDSNSARSVSNEIKLIQAPILYVPNAFTPNGDTKNEIWRTVPVFVKDYHMHVYNRWGEYIWHADGKHIFWDGTFKGAPASNDAFIWQVEYTGWDGSQNFRHGYVTTLP